ncbi:glutathione S-transferase family protein [Kineobactrum salinum]|uniref:Glutathione S-transferase family protein n=1 Tax=Kineobactrum salinum TaxID=2708301 RepID=A0A6C0U896_9GAMM|nr:glutathione S-transferase family protein [Kineobactrum salinum]QIB66715.1 glutathione S-transferase family protein [Kineobactrum salinum]
MKDLTLYTNPYSRGRIARWMLEETGAPYDVKIMEYDGSIKAPEYLAINPMGKVPALVHGDTVVTETVAICAYLADQFPEKKLAPAVGSPERGSYYRWLFFVAGPLEMAMTARSQGWEIDQKAAQVVGCGLIGDTLATLEQALTGRDYLCGSQFTAADLVLGSYLGWNLLQQQIEPLPVFSRYVERLEAREAAKRANQLDGELE